MPDANDDILESVEQMLNRASDGLDDLLLDERFDECDWLLGSVNPDGLSTAVLLVNC